MVFSSIIFLCYFLPIFLIVYYISPSLKLKNYVLILFSLFFYAWGEPIWVSLLLISSVTDFISGKLIHKGHRNVGLIISLVVNFGLLGYFKYFDLLLKTLNSLSGSNFELLNLALPIGISFYTFQTMSYTIDMYLGNTEVQENFSSFLLYVSLFPQLVAGPIVRYRDVAYEIEHRNHSSEDFVYGIIRFSLGLGKKIIFANTAGELAQIYLHSSPSSLSVLSAWFGIFLFSLQIYFDFSGYSDMAIGIGRMIGFHFKENFNYPYISRSVSEFWRRWHMSLGSFFRDYLYIPLGGNRRNWLRNLFIVWFATGLWHGASWNFVAWGLYFGGFLFIERTLEQTKIGYFVDKLPRLFSHIYLLIIVVYGWTLFYFESIRQIFAYTLTMLGITGRGLIDFGLLVNVRANILWLVLAIITATPLPYALMKKLPRAIQYLISLTVLAIAIIMLVGQSYNPFLYFRF